MNCFLAGNKNFMQCHKISLYLACPFGFNLFLLEASMNSVGFLSRSTSSEMSMSAVI